MSHDLGDTVPLTVTVRDSAGVPVNATTITLTIQLPDGTTTTPVVANPPASTGVYAHDFAPSTAGRHAYRFVSTGPVSAFSDVFDVDDAFPSYVVGLADARAQLQQSSTVRDEDLRGVIAAATGVVERHTGKAIARRTITAERITAASGQLWLHHRPVVSLTSVTDAYGGALTVGDLTLNADWGQVIGSLCGTYTVTYVAGMTSIPAHFREAGAIIVQHLWTTQRGQRGGPRVGGALDVTLGVPGAGFAIPNAALELLGPPGVMVA